MVAAVAPSHGELLDIEAIRTLKAQRHLRNFVRDAWHVVEPFTPYSHNWHIDALSDHLEATVTGEIRNLVVTMPPRSMKSLTISVFFPAWVWIDHPHLRFLYASYAMRLSTEHSQATREVIESDWYRERWGDRVILADDDNLKTQFSNTARGKRSATSVGSSLTGLGGDILVADDPHNVQERESDAKRTAAVDWWAKSMSTRHNTPATGVKIVVQQRVHEDDVAGACIASGDYVHLNLPMEYEPTPFVSPLGWVDPRKEEGELLHPERMDAKFTADQKKTLGTYDYNAQYQQRPVPADGGILKTHWFGTYPIPELHYLSIIQSWDTGFKDGVNNDYSACVTLGIGLSFVDVLDVYSAQIQFPDLERALEEQHLIASVRFPGVQITVLVEDKGSGQSLIQVSHRRGSRNIVVIAIPAAREDEKIKRVHDISPFVEGMRVRLPADAHWRDSFLHEVTTFPLVKHDDVTDAFAIGASRAFGVGVAAAADVVDESAFDKADPRSRRPSPRQRRR